MSEDPIMEIITADWSHKELNGEQYFIGDTLGSRTGQTNTSLKDCIDVIKTFPSSYLEKVLKVSPSFRGEPEFVKSNSRGYKSIGLWLDYYLLGRSELSEILTFSEFHRTIKPRAEVIVALYRLAQEVWLRYPMKQYESPHVWMLYCEIDLLKLALEEAGFTAPPSPMGKTAHYKALVKETEFVYDLSALGEERSVYVASPGEHLTDLAREIAVRDINFEHDYWKPFWKEIRRCSRQIKNGKSQMTYLDEQHHIQVIKRGKQKKRGSGFAQ